MPEESIIHVVVFRGRKHWVAQCLEHDIATQAEELADVPRKLELALLAELEMSRRVGREPFASLPRAAERYWKMWQSLSALEGPPPADPPRAESFLGCLFSVQRPAAAVV